MTEQLSRERADFGQWAASIPPDFARRVRENPQIAIDLLVALRELLTDMLIAQGNMRSAATRDPRWEGCAESIQPRVDAARVALAAATTPDLSRAAAHYTEQARQAAEHRAPARMTVNDMDEDVQSLMDRDMG